MLFDKRKWLNTVISDGVEGMLIDFFGACDMHARSRGKKNNIDEFEQFHGLFTSGHKGKSEAEYFWNMKETLQSALRKTATIQNGQLGQIE